jgi:hypothetical protein
LESDSYITHELYLGTGDFTSKGNGRKVHLVPDWVSRDLTAEITVFFINIQTVMGPTPPGTGVMDPATSLTSANATSPTRRCPLFLVASRSDNIDINYQQNPFWILQNYITGKK